MVGVKRTTGVIIWVAALIIAWLPGAFYLVDNQPEQHLQAVQKKENAGTEKNPAYTKRWRFERKADDGLKAKLTCLQQRLNLPRRPSIWLFVGLAALLGTVGSCLVIKDITGEDLYDLPNWVALVCMVACLVEVIALTHTTFQDVTMLTPEHRAVDTLVESFNGLWWGRVIGVSICNLLIAFVLSAWSVITYDVHNEACRAAKAKVAQRRAWREQNLCRQLRLDGQEPILWLRPDGAEWNTLRERWRLWPWPRRELARHERGRLNWDDLYALLADEGHTAFVTELERQLTERATQTTRMNLRPARRLAQKIHHNVMGILQRRLAEIRAEDRTQVGCDLLQEAADACLQQFRTMMSTNISGTVQDALNSIRTAILKGSDTLQAVTVTDRSLDSTPLLPAGTRHCYRQGNMSVVVVEQMPGLRRIVCTNKLMNWQQTAGTEVNDSRQTIELSFPFVVFVVAYRHDSATSGSITSLRIYYRNSALRSLDDDLYLPNLPNTRDVGPVCMDLTRACIGVPLQQAIDAVITEFWTSCFNDHLPYNFEATAATEPRVKNFRTWADWSATNPENALGMKWLQCGSSLRQIVESTMCESGVTQSTTDLRQTLDRLFTDSWDVECRRTIEEYCADIRTDGRYSQQLQRRLHDYLEAWHEQTLGSIGRVLVAQDTDPALSIVSALVNHVNEDEQTHLLAIIRELCRSLKPTLPGGYERLLDTLQKEQEEEEDA